MNLKDIFHRIVAITFLVLLFIIAFTWIIFDFQSSSSSLKDSLGITSSLFGGITTIVAAYVAIVIYDGWKIEYNKNIEKEFIVKTLTSLENCHFNLFPIFKELEEIVGMSQRGIQIVNTYMPKFIFDKSKIEITSLNVSLLLKITPNETIKTEFKTYRESYELLNAQTTHFYRLYMADLNEYETIGSSQWGSLFQFRCNVDSPNPYLNKIKTYQQNYEKLNNSLLALIKA